MVLALAFHTKDPDGVGDAVNAVMFPDLSPAADFEAALLTLRWDSVFSRGTLTSFANTSLLLGHQKFAPVDSWYKVDPQIEMWELFYAVFLGVADSYPATTKIMALVK